MKGLEGGRPGGVGGSTAVGEALRVKEPAAQAAQKPFGVRQERPAGTAEDDTKEVKPKTLTRD